MFRSEVRAGYEGWPGTTMAYLQKSLMFASGSESFYGFRQFLPSNYAANTGQQTNIAEWHGTSSTIQAPFHLTIVPWTTPKQYHFDVHNLSVAGWNPAYEANIGAVILGEWVNFVIHHQWSTSSGVVNVYYKPASQGLINPVSDLKGTFTGKNMSTGYTYVYPLLGQYSALSGAPAANGVAYYSSARVGSTLAIVDPGNYN
jgi:hypothetical protein